MTSVVPALSLVLESRRAERFQVSMRDSVLDESRDWKTDTSQAAVRA